MLILVNKWSKIIIIGLLIYIIKSTSFFRTKYQTECVSNIIHKPHTLNTLHHSHLYLDAKFLFHTRHVVAEKEFIIA